MKKYFLLATIALALFACKENNTPEEPQEPVTPPVDTTTVTPPIQDENLMMTYFTNPLAWNGNFTEISHAMDMIAQPKVYAPSATQSEIPYPIYDVTPSDGSWPIDITINYGDSSIVGTDGLEHSGILHVHATGPWYAEGAVFTPTFENFMVYGSVLNGTQIITNTGRNEAGNIVFDVVVSNGVLGNSRDFIYSEHTLREVDSMQFSIAGTMKMESHVDTIPGYEISIDSVPLRLYVGDLYPTEGLVHIALDKPIQLELNEAGFQGKANIQYVDLQFVGKTPQDTYAVRITVTLQMGFVAMNMTIQCEMNEEGLIPESVQYVWE